MFFTFKLLTKVFIYLFIVLSLRKQDKQAGEEGWLRGGNKSGQPGGSCGGEDEEEAGCYPEEPLPSRL